MVFVTFGTHRLPFDRLARAVCEGVRAGDLAPSELFVQCGHTAIPDMELGPNVQKFLRPSTYAEWLDRASVVITHGGTGSVVRSLEAGKRLIVAPRRAVHGEVSDDHQVEMAAEMRRTGRCVEWDLEAQTLGEVLELVDELPEAPQSFGWPSLLPRLRAHLLAPEY